MNIVKELRERAESGARDRRVAEFGPAGGNPNAKAYEHLEWKAADHIDDLQHGFDVMLKALAEISDCVETLEDAAYIARKAMRRLGYAQMAGHKVGRCPTCGGDLVGLVDNRHACSFCKRGTENWEGEG